MEPLQIGWQQIVVAAIQLGYSYWLKNYSSLQNKWIPILNLGVAAVYFTIATVVQNPEGGIINAIATVLIKAAETAVISTGVHSALKNTFNTETPTQ